MKPSRKVISKYDTRRRSVENNAFKNFKDYQKINTFKTIGEREAIEAVIN